MKNFIISSILDIILIFASYFLFKNIINGSTRHKIYENFFSSFAKFVIYIFVISIIITGISALILYKTRFVIYLNIIAPCLVSILVGFLMSCVPTQGVSDKNQA